MGERKVRSCCRGEALVKELTFSSDADSLDVRALQLELVFAGIYFAGRIYSAGRVSGAD